MRNALGTTTLRWVLFSCAFASGSSTPRVAVWRRLRRAGAVPLKSGLYVLPATDSCVEAMQWLAREAQAEGADPIVVRAEAIEGVTEAQIVELFHAARSEDYADLARRVGELETQFHGTDADERAAIRSGIERLRADYQQIQDIDYFGTAAGRAVGARLASLAGAFGEARGVEQPIQPRVVGDYRGRRWVTRPRPFVDRIACLWLIRRFIDPAAKVRYADVPADDEVAFDMAGGEFPHIGNRCAFEVMVQAFGLDGPALAVLQEIVHEIDLHDGRYARPEVIGVEAILKGLQASDRDDDEVAAAGSALFDGLYISAQQLLAG